MDESSLNARAKLPRGGRLLAQFIAAAAIVSVTAGCASHDEPRSATAIDKAATTPAEGLSEQTLASFRAFGTEFTESDAVPKVTAEEAIKDSGGAFGLSTGEPAEIALGRLTVPTYGRETSDDPSVSVIDPFINDELVWIVVYDNVVQPGDGPAPVGDKDSSEAPAIPTETRAGLWVAVNAASGEVIRAESIGDGK